jgi:hypothetical protein
MLPCKKHPVDETYEDEAAAGARRRQAHANQYANSPGLPTPRTARTFMARAPCAVPAAAAEAAHGPPSTARRLERAAGHHNTRDRRRWRAPARHTGGNRARFHVAAARLLSLPRRRHRHLSAARQGRQATLDAAAVSVAFARPRRRRGDAGIETNASACLFPCRAVRTAQSPEMES